MKRLNKTILQTAHGVAWLLTPFFGSFLTAQEVITDMEVITENVPVMNNEFGKAVAVSDTVLVVTSNAPHTSYTGKAYVYVRADGADTWTYKQELVAPVRSGNDGYGSAAAISGDFIFIGASKADDGCTGGDCSSGSVFVFKNTNGTWSHAQTLHASPWQANAYFGALLVADGDTLVVSAPVDGTKGSAAGAVFVFTNKGGTWSQDKAVIGDVVNAGDTFGMAVSLDGDRLVAAASDNRLYIFERNSGGGNNWGQVKRLDNPDSPNTIRRYIQGAVEGDLLATLVDNMSQMRSWLSVHHRNEGGDNNWGQVASVELPAFFTGPPMFDNGSLYVKVNRYDPVNQKLQLLAFEQNGGTGAWELSKVFSPFVEEFDMIYTVNNGTVALGSFHSNVGDLPAGKVLVHVPPANPGSQSIWKDAFTDAVSGARFTGIGWIHDGFWPMVWLYGDSSWMYVVDTASTLGSFYGYHYGEASWLWSSDGYGGWYFNLTKGIWGQF